MATTNLESLGFTRVEAGGAPVNNPPDVTAPIILTGTGVPTVEAPKGSLYLRADGGGQSYINTDGGTTWSEQAPGGDIAGLTTDSIPVASSATTVTDSVLTQPSATQINPATDGDVNFGDAAVAVFNSFRGYSFGDVNVSANAVDPGIDSYGFGERLTISGSDSTAVGEDITITGGTNQVLGNQLSIDGGDVQGVGENVTVEGSDVQFLGEQLTLPSAAGSNSTMVVIGQGIDLTGLDRSNAIVLGMGADDVVIESGVVTVNADVTADELHAVNGATGSFTAGAKTVTVVDGIITSIV